MPHGGCLSAFELVRDAQPLDLVVHNGKQTWYRPMVWGGGGEDVGRTTNPLETAIWWMGWVVLRTLCAASVISDVNLGTSTTDLGEYGTSVVEHKLPYRSPANAQVSTLLA